jgi:Cu+-exporting ATPase
MARGKQDKANDRPSPVEPIRVRDPVRGMTVEPATAAAHAEHDGTAYFFCSRHCHDRVVAEPSRYAGAQPAAPRMTQAQDARGIYTCLMHPDVVQDHPGTCPKCGMALEPRRVAAAAEDGVELRDMSRRFRISAVLSIPVFLGAMGDELWPDLFTGFINPRSRQGLETLLATAVVL